MNNTETGPANDVQWEPTVGFGIVGTGMIAQYYADAIAKTPGARLVAVCRSDAGRSAETRSQFGVPSFAAVQAAVAGGALGQLVLGCVAVPYLRTQEYYRSAAWRGTWRLDGGGALMNQGIHLLDLLLWYIGDATEVQAQMTTLAHAIEVEDCITATVRFTNGALESVAATTAAAPGYPHRVEVYGDQGGLLIAGEQVVRWESTSVPHVPRATASPASMMASGAGSSPRGISGEGHQRLIADFVDALREKRQPIVPGTEGRRSLALALAMYESARTGRSVILE
jgi:UDP-N-acetyl-2-amino-2-deoxyglucuronate dehydrogenase